MLLSMVFESGAGSLYEWGNAMLPSLLPSSARRALSAWWLHRRFRTAALALLVALALVRLRRLARPQASSAESLRSLLTSRRSWTILVLAVLVLRQHASPAVSSLHHLLPRPPAGEKIGGRDRADEPLTASASAADLQRLL